MSNENREPRQWKTIEDDIREDELRKLDVGDVVEGTYLGTRTQNANGRPTQIYMFDLSGGGVIGLWETSQLSRKMSKCRKNKFTRVERIADIPAKVMGMSDEQNFDVKQAV